MRRLIGIIALLCAGFAGVVAAHTPTHARSYCVGNGGCTGGTPVTLPTEPPDILPTGTPTIRIVG